MQNPIGENKNHSAATKIAYIALFAATLTGGKLALSFLPNIEIVTILILVYASVFGLWYVLPATVVFCVTETLLYGFGTWVVAYFIYWNLLGVLASIVLKKRIMWQALVLAAVCTIFFGVLTTAGDVLWVCIGQQDASIFLKLFAAKYTLGLTFYALHLASSVVTVLVLYNPLCRLLERIKNKTLS